MTDVVVHLHADHFTRFIGLSRQEYATSQEPHILNARTDVRKLNSLIQDCVRDRTDRMLKADGRYACIEGPTFTAFPEFGSYNEALALPVYKSWCYCRLRVRGDIMDAEVLGKLLVAAVPGVVAEIIEISSMHLIGGVLVTSGGRTLYCSAAS
jgi:hypothetical protein